MSDYTLEQRRAISVHKSALAAASREERATLERVFASNDIPLLSSENHINVPVQFALALLDASAENAGLIELFTAMSQADIAYVTLDTTHDGAMSAQLIDAIEREKRFTPAPDVSFPPMG